MWKTNYTSIDPKQQQRMFPPRSSAIQNSWSCLAHSCLLFYSFITSTVQILIKKRDGPTHPGIHTEWRSLIFRRVQNWYKLFSLKRNQQIMMEQDPFPEERKKREEGGQAPEPQEPGGTSKSWWNRTPFLRKERREKKGDKHPNPSWNQEDPANHDGTEPLSWGKKEERRRETSTRTPARTKKNQQIMMEQNPFPEERKKREEGRQAPEPQLEPGRSSKSWWNRTPFLRKERREKKRDKHPNPS